MNLLEDLKSYTLQDLFKATSGCLSAQIQNFLELPFLESNMSLENLLPNVREKEIFNSLKSSLRKKIFDCYESEEEYENDLKKLTQGEVIRLIGGSKSKIGKRLLYFLSKPREFSHWS